MSSYSQIILICEDRQQEVFGRTFLVECGINKGRIRVRVCPRGKASGKQFVKDDYWPNVEIYRQKQHSMKIAIVVMTDADKDSVEQVKNGFDQLLLEHGLSQRLDNERIGLYIPKRNIETWIYFLEGHDVNEQDSYAHRIGNESQCKPFVKKLAEVRKSPLSENSPRSLRMACDELHRVID